jgi:hypothetical protein
MSGIVVNRGRRERRGCRRAFEYDHQNRKDDRISGIMHALDSARVGWCGVSVNRTSRLSVSVEYGPNKGNLFRENPSEMTDPE